MITFRPGSQRGHFNHGWLDSHHTFSFGDYHDARHMGFRSLRVINEDRVQPGTGFGMHGHRDMEIITFVMSGRLEHRDSMGNGEVISPGEIQMMSAGTGVRHSEANPSKTDPVHLLQIWIVPDTGGLRPRYEQKRYQISDPRAELKLLVSGDGRDGSVRIKQDADLYLAAFGTAGSLSHELGPSRHAWVQVARGDVRLNGLDLHAGDGAAVSSEVNVTLSADASAEALLFDLA